MKTAKTLYACATLIFINGCETTSERSVLSVIDGTTLSRVNSDLSAVCVDLFVNSKTTDGKRGYQIYKGKRRHFAAGFDALGSNISCAWIGNDWSGFSDDETRVQAIQRCNELMPGNNGCQIYADGNEIILKKIDIAKSDEPIDLNNLSIQDQIKFERIQVNPKNLPACPKPDYSKKTDLERFAKWSNCWGRYPIEVETKRKGEVLEGEWLNGLLHGRGTYYFRPDSQFKSDKYVGEFKDDKYNGQGIFTFVNGEQQEGIWENNNFIREAKVNLPNLNKNITTNTNRTDIDRERQQLAEDHRRLEEEKRQREQAKSSQKINLQVSHTQPATDGSLTLNIQTNADTASLKINGDEQGGRANGDYLIKKVARAGQETKFTIAATDINGNKDTQTITVSRAVVESKAAFAALNPANIKKQVERDAVAVVIGIADYRSLPKADFSNDDARAFYDYAIRALGIKPENIKLLVDGDAEEAEILKTFRTWLPSRVKSTTDVYVFYSGHGLPMPDGKGLYLVPPRADREVIDDTAIPFSKLNAAITLAKPKSVTIFLDSCYSGQARSGETLVANARPMQLKSDSRYFPENFTVITASQNDQISSSNPELQHGIFSYYLMKGMEGDADSNKDGKITLGEMQSYLAENVSRHAAMMSRKQEPQLIGDFNRVLVGR